MVGKRLIVLTQMSQSGISGQCFVMAEPITVIRFSTLTLAIDCLSEKWRIVHVICVQREIK